VFSFRTIAGSENALQKAIEGSSEHVGSLFSDIELGDEEKLDAGRTHRI